MIYVVIICAGLLLGASELGKFIAARYERRKEKARQAIIRAHAKRVELMKQLAEIDHLFWEAKVNNSQDCFEVTREQAN